MGSPGNDKPEYVATLSYAYPMGNDQPKYVAPEIWNQSSGLPAPILIPNSLVFIPKAALNLNM